MNISSLTRQTHFYIYPFSILRRKSNSLIGFLFACSHKYISTSHKFFKAINQPIKLSYHFTSDLFFSFKIFKRLYFKKGIIKWSDIQRKRYTFFFLKPYYPRNWFSIAIAFIPFIGYLAPIFYLFNRYYLPPVFWEPFLEEKVRYKRHKTRQDYAKRLHHLHEFQSDYIYNIKTENNHSNPIIFDNFLSSLSDDDVSCVVRSILPLKPFPIFFSLYKKFIIQYINELVLENQLLLENIDELSSSSFTELIRFLDDRGYQTFQYLNEKSLPIMFQLVHHYLFDLKSNTTHSTSFFVFTSLIKNLSQS